jgi:hypothetical protein
LVPVGYERSIINYPGGLIDEYKKIPGLIHVQMGVAGKR